MVLAVEPEQLQLSPVVQLLQYWVPYLIYKAVLHSLQEVDTALVRRGPQLAAVIRPQLDKTAQQGHHDLKAAVAKGAEDPARQAGAGRHCMFHLGTENKVRANLDPQVPGAMGPPSCAMQRMSVAADLSAQNRSTSNLALFKC